MIIQAEKYPYNATYAFSENRVIDGVELEGLEVSLTNGNDTISGPLSQGAVNEYLDNGYVHTNESVSMGPESNSDVSMFIPLGEVTVDVSSDEQPDTSVDIVARLNEIDKMSNTDYPDIKELTDYDVLISKEYERQAALDKYYSNMMMYEPVLSGYYGGANQYPIISGALYSFGTPDNFMMNVFYKRAQTRLVLMESVNSWANFKRMKGLTLVEKARLYRNAQKSINSLRRNLDKMYYLNTLRGNIGGMQKIQNYHSRIKNEN